MRCAEIPPQVRCLAYTGLFHEAGEIALASGRTMRAVGCGCLRLLAAMPALRGEQTRFDAEAIRLNNRGVALMGQQFTERAAESFAEAFKKDPKLAQAAVNEGIALLTLQKLDEAKEWLRKAIALDPNSAQAWYNLGLAQHARQRACGCAGQLSTGGEARSREMRTRGISKAPATRR